MRLDAIGPLRVAGGFWLRDEVHEALRARDVGGLFRLLRRYAGASQMQIGMAVWLEQGYVSKVMNGRRDIVRIELLDRIAHGLAMPDHCRVLVGLAPTGHDMASHQGGGATGSDTGPSYAPADDARRDDPVQRRDPPSLVAETATGFSHADLASARPHHVAFGQDIGGTSMSHAAMAGRASSRGMVDPDDDWPDSFARWELSEVLTGGGPVGADQIGSAEAACARLDKRYAQLSPQMVLPQVSVLLRRTVGALGRPQQVEGRRRLCALAGRLAGLRGWLLFDLANHTAADAWYRVGLDAAREAEDGALVGWLLGARSLIPSYQHDHRAALALIEQAQSAAAPCADATVTGWLYALRARGCAGLRDRQGYREAHGQAERLTARTRALERRHGMDFHRGRLDLSYYAGTSLLLLREPGPAAERLRESLTRLPAKRVKARAILLLALAAAAGQRRDAAEACRLACQALSVAEDQPIMPILQRARDLERQLGSGTARDLTPLREQLQAFSASLGVHRTRRPR